METKAKFSNSIPMQKGLWERRFPDRELVFTANEDPPRAPEFLGNSAAFYFPFLCPKRKNLDSAFDRSVCFQFLREVCDREQIEIRENIGLERRKWSEVTVPQSAKEPLELSLMWIQLGGIDSREVTERDTYNEFFLSIELLMLAISFQQVGRIFKFNRRIAIGAQNTGKSDYAIIRLTPDFGRANDQLEIHPLGKVLFYDPDTPWGPASGFFAP